MLKRGLRVILASLRTSIYTFGYYHGALREKQVLLYAKGDGEQLRRVERELRENPAYRGFRVSLVRGQGMRCARHIGAAKYLIADGALPDWYTKREGQVLALIGDRPSERGYNMGDIQRSCLNSDFIFCSDAAMRAAIADTYFLDGLYQGTFVLSNDAEEQCARVLRDIPAREEVPAKKSEKENVLIFVKGLHKNGQTTSLRNLWAMLDLSKRNYYISFPSDSLKDDPSRLNQLYEGTRYIPMPHMRQESLMEKLAFQLYLKKNLTSRWVIRYVERYFKRLYLRSFWGCDFRWAIDHNGYDPCVLNMLPAIPAKRAVYVHNDMLGEMKTRGYQHRPTLERVYRACDRVIPVTQDIVEPTEILSGRSDNTFVVNNCHDWQGVLRRAEQPLSFDADTCSNVPREELEKILNSDAVKIVTIGRYSPEKGHAQLLEAFERFHREVPNSYLILIGGRGVLYEETVRRASELDCRDHVALIISMKNPMPLLKKCDLFVLSSLYEGLGLVMLEADTLGVPVISTDVQGPRGFLREHGGVLVAPNADGLYQGMRDFLSGKVKPMNVDYAEYNRRAIAQFEAMLEEKA